MNPGESQLTRARLGIPADAMETLLDGVDFLLRYKTLREVFRLASASGLVRLF